MTRARMRVLLGTAWAVTNLLLIVAADVPPLLAAIGNLAGGVVIALYLRGVPEAPLTRAERVVRVGAYVVLGAVAGLFALILAVTMLAFLIAWLAGLLG